MSQYMTETAQMNTAAQHVDQVNQQVAALLSQLRGEVQTVSGFWKGSAMVSFTELMARYDADAQKLNQALQGISTQIKQSGVSYTSADETHSASFKSAGSALNLG